MMYRMTKLHKPVHCDDFLVPYNSTLSPTTVAGGQLGGGCCDFVYCNVTDLWQTDRQTPWHPKLTRSIAHIAIHCSGSNKWWAPAHRRMCRYIDSTVTYYCN